MNWIFGLLSLILDRFPFTIGNMVPTFICTVFMQAQYQYKSPFKEHVLKSYCYKGKIIDEHGPKTLKENVVNLTFLFSLFLLEYYKTVIILKNMSANSVYKLKWL